MSGHAAAPALAGVIAAKSGYHAAFALSAVLSFLGTVAYIATYKKFFGNIGLEPDDPLPADKKRSFVVKMLIVVAIVGTALAVSFATGKLKISSFANVVSTISIFIPLAYLVFIYSSKKTVGAALNMILVNFYKEGSEVPFFIGIGAVVAILGAVVLAFSKKLAEGMGMEREA